MSKTLKLNDKHTIADLRTAINDIARHYPVFMDFLEQYCGFYFPVMSSNPNDICYSAGKRDVILTIKTISRDDISPENVAALFNEGNINGSDN